MDYKDILSDLFAEIEAVKAERLRAGTRFRLMGVTADIADLTRTLQQEVLDVVCHEALVDADAEVDYAVLAEEVMAHELTERAEADEQVREQTQLANEALGLLSDVLVRIEEQLERHHKDEEYERLYETEKRRYMSSGTAYRSRKTFEEWKDDECYGHPLQENIEDYRMEKLLKMFEKGVFTSRVEHVQRAKRYPGEVDFEQLEDDHPMKKTAHRHYAVLRKLVDWCDGCLVVNAARVGRHFYACRHEENAKANRTNFLKYMHKVSLAQEELRRLQAAQEEVAKDEAVKDSVPECLRSEEAVALWQKAQGQGWVDEAWQPLVSSTEAALLAMYLAERLGIVHVWKVFGSFWHRNKDSMRQKYNEALNQQKSLDFQTKLKQKLR